MTRGQPVVQLALKMATRYTNRHTGHAQGMCFHCNSKVPAPGAVQVASVLASQRLKVETIFFFFFFQSSNSLQSCELVHFLSSTVRRSCFLLLRPHPAVRLPRREKARITDGLLGTLLGLRISIFGKKINQKSHRGDLAPFSLVKTVHLRRNGRGTAQMMLTTAKCLITWAIQCQALEGNWMTCCDGDRPDCAASAQPAPKVRPRAPAVTRTPCRSRTAYPGTP